jgi:EAL domain-containing protein (putative c-di-GMP-specific phosphodiesterase class I)
MAQLLDIRTIAENVDNETVIAKLKSIGLDYAQGYYLGDLVLLDDVGSELVNREISRVHIN